jgi:hypothetical protein
LAGLQLPPGVLTTLDPSATHDPGSDPLQAGKTLPEMGPDSPRAKCRLQKLLYV